MERITCVYMCDGVGSKHISWVYQVNLILHHLDNIICSIYGINIDRELQFLYNLCSVQISNEYSD